MARRRPPQLAGSRHRRPLAAEPPSRAVNGGALREGLEVGVLVRVGLGGVLLLRGAPKLSAGADFREAPGGQGGLTRRRGGRPPPRLVP